MSIMSVRSSTSKLDVQRLSIERDPSPTKSDKIWPSRGQAFGKLESTPTGEIGKRSFDVLQFTVSYTFSCACSCTIRFTSERSSSLTKFDHGINF